MRLQSIYSKRIPWCSRNFTAPSTLICQRRCPSPNSRAINWFERLLRGKVKQDRILCAKLERYRLGNDDRPAESQGMRQRASL